MWQTIKMGEGHDGNEFCIRPLQADSPGLWGPAGGHQSEVVERDFPQKHHLEG